MTRLEGRTSLTIVVVIIFALLVIVYHFLSNEVDDISTGKIHSYLKNKGLYDVNDITDDPATQKKHNSEKLSDKLKIVEKYRYDGIFTGHKIVHLDLKGAPPKVTYYEYLFRLLKTLGATGILIEYEDMFPFEGDLIDIGAGNRYSRKEIYTIQKLAEKNDLMVIPLVQTFGHLEFVLKLEKYKDLREMYRYPQSICPTHIKSLPLLFEMINQVIMAHPKSNYLHIGADEVYQLGECTRCMDTMAKHKWVKRELFLNHVTKVAKYVKEKNPHITILMWDDEFREIESQELIDSGLNWLVEPVIWKYTTDPGSLLTDQLWDNYALVWHQVWIATAFKGATVPDRYYTDISHHVQNHRRWLEIIEKYSSRIKFKGVFLTGWQRYDHFSVLCELLPTALPSLAVNLAVLQSSDPSDFPIDVPTKVTEALLCEGGISLSIPEPQYGWTKCNYLGVLVYAATLKLFSIEEELSRMKQDNTFKGWITPYNIKYSFSSPSHVERAVTDLDRFKMEILYLEKELRAAMEDIYDSYTIQEWLETHLVPLNDEIEQIWEVKEKILEKEFWPRRPLTKEEL